VTILAAIEVSAAVAVAAAAAAVIYHLCSLTVGQLIYLYITW